VSQKELQRLKVVENAVEGRLSVVEAAELLQLSDRQAQPHSKNSPSAEASIN
jgi:predicted HTH domain antitoxin